MSSPRVLVIGSANIDLVTRVARIPQPGETLAGRSFATILGGKGANQAVAAARLGAQTWFAGCVGCDTFGGMQAAALAQEGIDLTYLKRHASEPTGTASIFVTDDGQNAIVITSAANACFLPADVEAIGALFEQVDAVVLQLESPLDTVQRALELARAVGTLSVLDIGVAQDVSDALLRCVDVVSPNESEARAMTGVEIRNVDDAARAAAELRKRGSETVVLKLGALGAYFAAPGTAGHVAAFPIQPVDTTGAGDAFTAALAMVWRSMPPMEALRFANAAGALAASRSGAQCGMPARADLDVFLENA